MKRIFLLLFLIVLFLNNTFAQSSQVKKAADAVFSLTTFKADGSILATANGVFVTADGMAVSPWLPFVGASKAVVTDSKGVKHDVDAVIGANAIYDVAKFRVKDKVPASILAAQSKAGAGNRAWIVPDKRSNTPKNVYVKAVETFMDKYAYYIIDAEVDEIMNGCPVTDDSGRLLGIVNISGSAPSVTDIAYPFDFSVNAMSMTDITLRQTDIRIALPSEEKDALLALMLSSDMKDAHKYEATFNEFIAKFPKLNDGYYAGAVHYVSGGNYSDADRLMKLAEEKTEAKDEAHYNMARIILAALSGTDDPASLPQGWTLDKALEETDVAYSISPQPIYKQLKAQIFYASGRYEESYNEYMALTNTDFDNADLYYQAMQAKAQMGAPDEVLMELIEKAIEKCDTPYTSIAAPYFLARALQYDKMQNYRKAMLDFYRYEILMNGNVGHEFYFYRGESEMRGKLYQQALNDLAHAVALDPKNTMYWAELASANLKVKKFNEAIISSQECLRLDDKVSEAYLILGVSLAETGKKTEGLENMRKAQELGNEQAASFIEKYK